jgi:two-component system sensor histidine kinase KdpD
MSRTFSGETGRGAAAAADSGESEAKQVPVELRDLVLVAIAPDEDVAEAEHLMRTAHRYAQAYDAAWTVVCVETPAFLIAARPGRDSRINLFRLANSLGAETAVFTGASPAQALQEYCKLRGARSLVVGAPRRQGGWRFPQPPTSVALTRAGLDADLIVVARRGGATEDVADPARRRYSVWSRRASLYAAGLGLTAVCSAIALPMVDHFDLIDMVMVYLLGATFAALRLGRGPAVFTSLANIAAFDFFIVPPRLSFAVYEPHYFITFGVMLAVSLIIANLVSAVRQQTLAAITRERRTAALYAMSRELAVNRDADAMAAVAERNIGEASQSSVVVLVSDERGHLQQRGTRGVGAPNMPVCRWVLEHQQRAGHGSGNYGTERSIYLPLIASQDVRGVLVVRPADPKRAAMPEQSRLLEAMAGQLALALERVRLADVAQSARLSAERAALRNTLLASISHDLRTPLSAIAGAGSMMAHDSFPLDSHRRITLGRLIEDKARDMTELLSNVLELMRLETGAASVKREWHLLEDLVGQTLRQNEGRLSRWRVFVELPADLPMLFVEASLIVQVLSNLVENSTKYTPPGTKVVIGASATLSEVLISVEDDGPGFGSADPERLFDKFERGRAESNVAGAGLGLAICRAVTRLHGGDIRALHGAAGGARFEITLPLAPLPQEVAIANP